MAAASKHRHDHSRCVKDALDAAARVCDEKGVQLTKVRRRVLELVWSDHKAVKAYDLLDRMGDEKRSAKPPTVYRALEFLMEQGLVHRVDSLNAFVGCPKPGERHEGTLLICNDCGGVAEIESPAIREVLTRESAAAGFRVQHPVVELHGTCVACTTD